MVAETITVREQGPSDEALPEWTMKYPEQYRKLLKIFGVDDRGRRTLEAFNHEIIDTSKYCHGKSRFVFKTLMEYMYEDWHDVLARHEPKAKGEGSGGPAFAAEVEGPESEGGKPAPETPIN